MSLRVFRLAAVASIIAFGLVARTAATAHATTDDPPALSPPIVDELPPAEPSEPPSTEPPPSAPPESSDPDVTVEPSDDPASTPPDPDEPAPIPPPETSTPPPDAPALPEPSPIPSDVPPQGDPESSQPGAAVPEPPLAISDPVLADPIALETISTVPPSPPTMVPALPLVGAGTPAPAASSTAAQHLRSTLSVGYPTSAGIPARPVTPVAAAYGLAPAPVAMVVLQPSPAAPTAGPAAAPTASSAAVTPAPPGERVHVPSIALLNELEPAGFVAGLAVTNRAPVSVAVAIEFGRAGSGWAGAIVFNLWLRRQLRERRMSQRQLAALSGVDHSTISRLLKNDRRPSLATATKLAKALRQVRGETDAAAYFDRIPEETLFPAKRVEMALRADELLDDDDVRRLMSAYHDTRRRRHATAFTNGVGQRRFGGGPADGTGGRRA